MSRRDLGRLSGFKAFMFDLDGCIYRGRHLIPGALECIKMLTAHGRKVLFVTNNATRTPASFAWKLRSLGIAARSDEILTSSTATAIYLADRYGRLRIFAIGEEALKSELLKYGHAILKAQQSEKAHAVVVGLDRRFDYAKLRAAANAITAGARFIATNADPILPSENGFIPGAGSIVAAISAASGRAPETIGKPSTIMTKMALDRLSIRAKDAAVVGDRLDTDIQSGKAMGAFTILVLSGATRREHLIGRLPAKPDLVIRSVAEIPKYL